MTKTLLIFGTRPEAIKMLPLFRAFQTDDAFETKVCVTAQHRKMLDQVLDFFEVTPDYDLDLMRPSQDLHQLTADIITGLKPILEDFSPDYVFVHGDTTTTMAASIAAFYTDAKVCHVEAGLRTFNKKSPFPEEVNRCVTGVIADYHFAPTARAKANLLKENIHENNILVTGNTVIDALYYSREKVNASDFKNEEIEYSKRLVGFYEKKLAERSRSHREHQMILITGHRRENHGQGFLDICKALKQIALNNSEVQLIYPVHLNPNVQKPVYDLLGDVENIKLINPLSYPAFVWLMNRAYLIITDSGGVQEEAPSLGKPVLVMRDTTERPEAVEAGTVLLVGTDTEKIIRETEDLLNNQERYEQMSALHNPYGDGTASEQIVRFIRANTNHNG